MSLYNIMNGMSATTFFILPVLGKHPDEYPRFRDAFVGDKNHPEYDGKLLVYTRVGGGNRDDYAEEIQHLRDMPTYVTDYDDDFDNTYANFIFDIPEEFKADVDMLLVDEFAKVSEAYIDQCCKVFPNIADKLRASLSQPS